MTNTATVCWRAVGSYSSNNASKTGLVGETRCFLLAWRRLGDLAAARTALIDGELPQRSRETRATIVQVIQARLVRWEPPLWILNDLAGFASEGDLTALRAALLLHVPRQDRLLYDLVQMVILPRWQEGVREIGRADVQRFLDARAASHPEVSQWRHETREKLAGNLLTILRDYGLLAGGRNDRVKTIVEPVVPVQVARHLVKLLDAEGLALAEMPHHPDWRLWLWEPARAKAAMAASAAREGAA
ncbi:MAG: DUF1819 family protein [Chloroflexi bacterium]|nr:DUF1819 family protein [Chloroflexota bacterium]